MCIQAQQIVYINYVQCFVHQLYLSKAGDAGKDTQ